MKTIVAEQYMDSLTRVRVMLDTRTTQLSLLVSRCADDTAGFEKEYGPFDSIGGLRDGLQRVFDDQGVRQGRVADRAPHYYASLPSTAFN